MKVNVIAALPTQPVAAFLLALGAAALASWLMLPLFRRYALARPNHRSSHKEPTPQGGGVAILLAAGLVWSAMGVPGALPVMPVIIGTLVLGVLGAWDDLSPLPWRSRLAAQAAVILALLLLLPAEWRVVPAMPRTLEVAIALVLGLWFVNLVNFMDGIDGILVMGLAPMLVALGAGFGGITAPEPVAAVLGGALCGFLVLNRPRAALFAGDVGSLSVALVAAVLLFQLAALHSLVAAILLPLYFVMDASHTLLMRLARGANLAEAHREHAYQRALDGGLSNWRIILSVLALNLVLIGLAALAIANPALSLLWLAAGIALTAMLIMRFRAQGRP